MKKIMITAMHSGAGKTVVSCGLMAALKHRGLAVQAFKAGPDYIDPMFHTRVLGVPSRSLDLFLQGEGGVLRSLHGCPCDVAVIEGAMGYYDGLNYTDRASAWALGRLTDTPAVLVVRPGGSALSLAAQIRGMLAFRPDSGIAALILSDCREGLAQRLAPVLEGETGLPVLGFLPPMPDARIESRHLGLCTAEEIADLAARFDAVARQMEQSVNLDRLLSLCTEDAAVQEQNPFPAPRCRIAAAHDAAFCFTYADTLDALRRQGAEIVPFRPLSDAALPADIRGLYLPGGYPELYAAALSENAALREEIRTAVQAGLPTVAECGGFLYLLDELEGADGLSYPMCGALSGRGYRTDRLQRFGYQTLTAPADSLLFRAGERVNAHEFHYWDATETGNGLMSTKADGRRWPCAFVTDTLYAGFPHLSFAGETPLAARFVEACIAYGQHI